MSVILAKRNSLKNDGKIIRYIFQLDKIEKKNERKELASEIPQISGLKKRL